ncbi:ATP-dependent Clp protease proteolytic subunit [Leptolyngbyaceae cyanobacterium CCMR0082]|uniref:ATP-dependent Clp protease proteolytic subunit n=1 Tax=Adonisia turfae CCMR0082 TaxID=2304604 RepID=A0A6M0S5A6_9CYAN|nr:ATP-dependent Clp protease proteolytic subunit [Adonisia turfae]NEZ63151.1 ATP-dependent Clp protease proteolytic subunit [Adonisia turfae CCMR0082]
MSVERPIRVPYNLPGSQRWTWVNIYTRMSQERILFLNQPLTDGVANSLISAFLYLDSEDPGKPIYLYINSLGDPVMAGMADGSAGMMSITSGLAIYDTMRHIKSDVITICMGQAIGMSAVLLSCGAKGKRSSLPNSSIALVHPYSGTRGQATDIELNADEVLSKSGLITQLLSENTGQPEEKIHKDMERIFYLTPQEAIEYGLIDRVIEKPA